MRSALQRQDPAERGAGIAVALEVGLADDRAVTHADHPVGGAGHAQVVGDEDDRLPFLRALAQNADDVARGAAVEVPGRLVGQQQRVAIARALVNRPSVLLADEPTGNLDSAAAREVVGVLRERSEEGQAIVLVTHDLRVASAAHRVIRMRDGAIVGESDLEGEADPAAALGRVLPLEG